MGRWSEPKKKEGEGRRWYQKYLPFIARTPEMQVKWLVAECRKKRLAPQELTPYVRLLFSEENVANEEEMREILAGLPLEMQKDFLRVADIYDVPRIMRLSPALNDALVEIALTKELPLYETKPQKVMDALLGAVNERSAELLVTVAARIMAKGAAPPHFAENYKRFRAILKDEEFIRRQWPQAK